MVRPELLSLSLYALLANNRSGLFIVFLPLYLVGVKGASLPVALAILSLAYVPASLLGPFVGRLSDRWGRRRVFLLAGEALAFPLFLGVAFAPGWALAGALFVGAELALAVGSPAYNAFVADLTHDKERGAAYGLLNATASAGAVVGVVLAGVVTFEFGLVALLPFVVAVMVGTLAVVFVLVPDLRVAPTPHARPLRELRPVVDFSFVVSIRAIGSGAVAAFYGYLAASLGASYLEVSAVAVAGLVTGAVLSLPLGRQIDRVGEIRGIWYGTALSLGSYGIFAAATDWAETVPAQAIRSAGLALVSPGMLSWVARTAPPGHRAEYLGVFSLVNSTFWSIGPLVGAVALEAGGYDGLFLLAVVTTAVSLAGMELRYGRAGRRRRGSESAAAAAGAPGSPPARA